MKRNGKHCGGVRGGRRCRRFVLRRREERAAPPQPVEVPSGLLARVEAVAKALATLPAPWSPDIDDPVHDAAGHVVDGEWTGKVYTERRGSWCWYLDEEGGVRTTQTVMALCELRNLLPEMLAAMRAGRKS